MPFSFDYALKTHPGLVRPLNEDAIGADPQSGLFVLADGLGGYNAGEIASTMAVSTLLSRLAGALAAASEQGEPFDPRQTLHTALVDMNSGIFRAALNSAAFEGMATTVVVAWLLGDRLWVAHTGDSRLYRLRDGDFAQITRDHSFSQELLDAGMVTEDEARLLPAKNLVTRALGASPEIEPEIHDYDVASGDVLLLCSDGLTEMVMHAEIGRLVKNSCRISPKPPGGWSTWPTRPAGATTPRSCWCRSMLPALRKRRTVVLIRCLTATTNPTDWQSQVRAGRISTDC
jgi:PPM family protein phosphatase